ncbi:MAG: HAMP domain-containing protein [Cryomorphaceae bacterium]|nr:MAG: HAMP domain-containing protein [Cryomorphaceae bacterium]
MSIRLKISLLFTLLTASILLIFAAVVYYSASQNREKEFYAVLVQEAITKANLLFDARVDPFILQNIYRSNREILNEVEVAVYNADFELMYHDAVDIDYVKETRTMFNNIIRHGEIRFYQGDWQVVGIKYVQDKTPYVITAAAYDAYGFSKLAALRRNMTLIFVLACAVIFVAGWYFSRMVFNPVRAITQRAQNISASNLDLRIDTGKNRDELWQMAETFNDMLNRLESSFSAQKHFVHNISHELRTPLAAIISELELSLQKERSTVEYRQAVQDALNDARKLDRLSQSLLDLARASYDPSRIRFKPERVDELLLDACRQVQQLNPGYRVEMSFDTSLETESETPLTLHSNAYLLKVAFMNLMENGCKFSPENKVLVRINVHGNNVQVEFENKGAGIQPEEIEHVFTPFFRGRNLASASGHGIGLSLTRRIIELHKGSVDVQSKPGQSTIFRVQLG